MEARPTYIFVMLKNLLKEACKDLDKAHLQQIISLAYITLSPCSCVCDDFELSLTELVVFQIFNTSNMTDLFTPAVFVCL